MALIKFGGGVVQMSGSIAGSTFARNRYGNYARARTKPINPKTDRQVAVRAAMAALTSRWSQTLTGVQRTAWNLYGSSVTMKNRLGENIFLTGFNHYIRSNHWRQRIGVVPIDAGPVIFELPEADPALSIAISEATNQFTVTYDALLDWADEDGGFLIVWNGQPQNAQRNFFAGPWRHLNQVTGVNGAPPASPAAMGASFVYSEGQRAWVYARILRADGRLSAPFRSDASVGA